ncbi:hypothetical protein NL676_033674 [Syzygium grande]|nr:hypothetical protein NL676_033674 [Syzygium grande]
MRGGTKASFSPPRKLKKQTLSPFAPSSLRSNLSVRVVLAALEERRRRRRKRRPNSDSEGSPFEQIVRSD